MEINILKDIFNYQYEAFKWYIVNYIFQIYIYIYRPVIIQFMALSFCTNSLKLWGEKCHIPFIVVSAIIFIFNLTINHGPLFWGAVYFYRVKVVEPLQKIQKLI